MVEHRELGPESISKVWSRSRSGPELGSEVRVECWVLSQTNNWVGLGIRVSSRGWELGPGRRVESYLRLEVMSPSGHSWELILESRVGVRLRVWSRELGVESRVLGGDLIQGGGGSEEAWHHRKPYIESWWRPNVTIGHLLLDVPPQGEDLLPWSLNSPPYRVSDDVPRLVNETNHVDPRVLRMVHGIMEVVREAHEGRYAFFRSADRTTMSCTADIGVNLSPLMGSHQIDLRGDLSGFLSSHPKSLLISLHHFDTVDPIFPSMDRAQSGYHLLNAAKYDQSRMLQQTICYKRSNNWTFSISWGYSAHIYENIMPRSLIQNPIETFKPWGNITLPPHYIFDTRNFSWDPCETPHMYFFQSIEKTPQNKILTKYIRAWPRGIGVCLYPGSYPAEYVNEIHVYSTPTKRLQINRCECCDVIHKAGSFKAAVRYRECKLDEIIA
ncbi:hypothetical protein KY285_008255 [Solanum tuberosum]|nr:hypothetical protein KY285_008255 [Solanum tuberosum]